MKTRIDQLAFEIIDQRSVLLAANIVEPYLDLLHPIDNNTSSTSARLPLFTELFLAAFVNQLKDATLLPNEAIKTAEDLTARFETIETYFDESTRKEIETYGFLHRHLLPYLLKGLPTPILSNIGDYLKELKQHNDSNQVEQLVEALSWILFEIKLSPTEILTLLREIIALEVSVELIWDGLMTKGPLHTETIFEIVDQISIGYLHTDHELFRCLLSTLYRHNPIAYFPLLEKFFDRQEWKPLVVNVLGFGISIENSLILRTLNLAESVDYDDINSQAELARLYVSILHSFPLLSEPEKERCKQGLFQLVTRKEVALQTIVMLQCRRLKEFQEFVSLLTIALLDNPNHSPDFYFAKPYQPNLLDSIYSHTVTNLNLFTEFLRLFSQRVPKRFNDQQFYSSINYHLRNDLPGFGQAIMAMLYDELGVIRLLGNELLDRLIEFDPNYRFGPFLLQLPEQGQASIILSLNYWLEPDFLKRFRFLLPLFSSPYETTINLLVGVIMERFDGYSEMVDILRKELPIEMPDRDEFIDRLNHWREELIELRTLKQTIKEISPVYIQTHLLDYFNKIHRQKWSTQLKKGVKEKSLIGMLGFKQIPLAKGGGWVIEGNDEIQQLGRVGTTIKIPAAIYQHPELFTLEVNSYYSQNWSDASDWQQWLKKFSYGSISRA